MHTTPVSLLLRLKQPKPEAAWQRFVDLYTPLLFYWARQTGLQSPDDADLVQDVFAVLVEKLPEFKYDRQKSFRGWMRTVMLNRWRDHRRRMATARTQQEPEILAGIPDPVDEAFWEEEHRQQLVSRALELMKTDFEEKTWRACWECVVADRPVADVAAELGMTSNAIYVAKYRVIRHLRRELEGLL
ncbi:MAG TPA: sigma-70 family RNA polymerase sigma factor [Pirellulales bacterium]|nr:sigma-70 family RNA polymerase sigma factor [Pirellulales bacterium]